MRYSSFVTKNINSVHFKVLHLSSETGSTDPFWCYPSPTFSETSFLIATFLFPLQIPV